ncbi:MAG: caspase family protein [Sphingobacteriales bacterium]|nr:MAG: caspase family protein [Sphingobacteriales bacterium]
MADENEIKSKGRGSEEEKESDANGKGERKNFIICVGIGEYENPALSLGPCCKNDCEEVAKVLIEDYDFEVPSDFYKKKGVLEKEGRLELFDADATLPAIRSLFANLSYHDLFRKAEEGEDLPLHNLIVYYSGHGVAHKDGDETFFWAPSDYDGNLDNPDTNLLYSVFYELNRSFRNIRYHNLIIISDACQSASSLKHTNWFPQLTKSDRPEKERLLFSICSSATNQRSYAGSSHSVFTEQLLQELNRNERNELDVELMALNLKTHFAATQQRVYYGRLLDIPDNAGGFSFVANDTKRTKLQNKERLKRLKKHVLLLNYTKQREWLMTERVMKADEKEGGGIKYFFCFSADYNDGISLAFHHVVKSKGFPEVYKKAPKSPQQLDSYAFEGTENYVIGWLCQHLQMPLATDKAQFCRQMEGQLGVAPVILEIFIDNENIVPEEKKEFVQRLYRLLSELEFTTKVKDLFVLVIDNHWTDYSQLLVDPHAGSISCFVMPKVQPLSAEALSDWETEITSIYDQAEIDEHDRLFRKMMECVKSKCFSDESEAPPGKLIQLLYEECKDNEGHLIYLNFQNLLYGRN